MVQTAASSGGFAAPGIITAWTSLPATGWLYCNGSQISRTVYDVLFAEIAVTWGVGDGSTTFNIPDLRGAFLRGTDSHSTQTQENGTAFAGATVGSYQLDQLQSHTHAVLDNSSGGGGYALSRTYAYGWGTIFGVSGARQGLETRPFSAGVQFCIKYD